MQMLQLLHVIWWRYELTCVVIKQGPTQTVQLTLTISTLKQQEIQESIHLNWDLKNPSFFFLFVKCSYKKPAHPSHDCIATTVYSHLVWENHDSKRHLIPDDPGVYVT